MGFTAASSNSFLAPSVCASETRQWVHYKNTICLCHFNLFFILQSSEINLPLHPRSWCCKTCPGIHPPFLYLCKWSSPNIFLSLEEKKYKRRQNIPWNGTENYPTKLPFPHSKLYFGANVTFHVSIWLRGKGVGRGSGDWNLLRHHILPWPNTHRNLARFICHFLVFILIQLLFWCSSYTSLTLPLSRCAEVLSTRAIAQTASYANEDSWLAWIPVKLLNFLAYSWAVCERQLTMNNQTFKNI